VEPQKLLLGTQRAVYLLLATNLF